MKAGPYIPLNSRVLNIGCADGALFASCHDVSDLELGSIPQHWIPQASLPVGKKGMFPAALGETEPFDAIVALAMLKHAALSDQKKIAASCFKLLRPGGRLKYPRQESNLGTRFRKPMLYPLSYGG